MAMSKAFRGLALPDYKRQKCGHTFNASGCKVCVQCRRARWYDLDYGRHAHENAVRRPFSSALIDRILATRHIQFAIEEESAFEAFDGSIEAALQIIADSKRGERIGATLYELAWEVINDHEGLQQAA